MIRVVQISTAETAGGAALAANRLHRALNTHDSGKARSTMFVGLAQRGGDGVQEFNAAAPTSPRFGRLLYRAARRFQHRVQTVQGPIFSQDWTVFNRLPLRQIPLADIYHLHWTSDLVDFRMLAPLAHRAPVIWTFHDMNPFTGGCHYDIGCGRFAAACGECPVLGSADPGDVSQRVIQRKLRALDTIPDDRLTVVSPSRWLADEARRSTVFGRFATRVIPNGIDLEVFRPAQDRAAVRRSFDLAPEDRVVLFVADILNDTRKGWSELEGALAETAVRIPTLKVITLGQGDTQRMSGPAFRHLGHVSDATKIRDAYNAADLFVIPSLQDNFPNTVIEALACGTPVVGFATGGVVDAVEEGVNGSLAPTGNVGELAARMVHLLSDDRARLAMSRAARERAVASYGLATQADAYLALYTERLELADIAHARVAQHGDLGVPHTCLIYQSLK